MGTTNQGWPYPESTDLVTDGAAAMQALAEAIDVTVTAQASAVSKAQSDATAAKSAAAAAQDDIDALGVTQIARGQGNVPVVAANGGVETVTITFPAGRFSGSPSLVVTPTHQRLNVGLQTVTATGATIIFANWTGIATASASGFHYVAVR